MSRTAGDIVKMTGQLCGTWHEVFVAQAQAELRARGRSRRWNRTASRTAMTERQRLSNDAGPETLTTERGYTTKDFTACARMCSAGDCERPRMIGPRQALTTSPHPCASYRRTSLSHRQSCGLCGRLADARTALSRRFAQTTPRAVSSSNALRARGRSIAGSD